MRSASVCLVAAGLLASCAFGSQEKHDLRLEMKSPSIAPLGTVPGSRVRVASIGARGVLAQRPLAYVDPAQPYEIHQYSRYRWEEAPAERIERLLVEYLRSARVAEWVGGPDQTGANSAVISGRLDHFERVLGTGRTHVEVELELRVNGPGVDAKELLGTYQETEDAGDGSIPRLLAAFDASLGRIFERFTTDLRAHLGEAQGETSREGATR